MKTVIIIPARYDSSRFPGKPLAKIKGQTLLYRIWSIAKQVKQIDEVYIATDHPEIEQHALAFGARVVLTGHCFNGTERVFAAARTLGLQAEDYVINLQGDAVLTPPWVIQALVDNLDTTISSAIHTLAVPMTKEDVLAMQATRTEGYVGGTMVVFDKTYRALYFSKSMIPFLREVEDEALPPCYRHIGLYGYSMTVLADYIRLPPSCLEKVEGLEQLRALENQIPVQVTLVDYRGRTHASIDNPSDVSFVERVIEQESELVPFPENKDE
jgi:3-deoxy-manno-octulosonate cytidylyltransferase (CMP-KDO synthetase)